jgi:hypothetical protein
MVGRWLETKFLALGIGLLGLAAVFFHFEKGWSEVTVHEPARTELAIATRSAIAISFPIYNCSKQESRVVGLVVC